MHGEERTDPAGDARELGGGDPPLGRCDQPEGGEEPALERLARLAELPGEDAGVRQAEVGVGPPAIPDDMVGEEHEPVGEEAEEEQDGEKQ